MPQPAISNRFVGILVNEGGALKIKPCSKKERNTSYSLNSLNGAKAGDIVLAERGSGGSSKSNVVQILGQETTPGILSTISFYEQGLSEVFSQAALKQAKSATVPELGDREDLRNIPLVTVDGVDSRDFDDAIFAEDTPDGGKHLIVAIADVSWYVRPGDALDQDAYRRGNSNYFPDRAIPMLPEALSNGLCSLKPNEDRACMAYHLWIDKDGNLVNKKINRALMRSVARLNYEQLQAAKDGKPDAMTAPIMDTVVKPLYAAYDILKAAADRRGMIELGSPEYKAQVDKNGNVVKIQEEGNEASHDVIAQFMILANVAGDQALDEAHETAIHRFHSGPTGTKLAVLRAFLTTLGFSQAGGDLSNADVLKDVIEEAKKLMPDGGQSVIKAVAMAQSKAIYDAQRDGHFGLALPGYGHHTSPIRRYADLFNHRALVNAFNMGAGGLTAEEKTNAQEIAEHITKTEILAVRAERAADDRYAALHLSSHIGKEFKGRITGVIGGGVFIRLDGMGIEGLLPVRALGDDFYKFDETAKTLTGSKSGKVYKSGDEMTVRVKEANALSGSILLSSANDNKTAKVPDQTAKKGRRPQQQKRRSHARGCSWPT